MAYRHLELTKTLAPQREILLRFLNGWSSDQLDDTLMRLSQKDAIRIRTPSELERIISLKTVSQTEKEILIASFDSAERKLYGVLEGLIGKG